MTTSTFEASTRTTDTPWDQTLDDWVPTEYIAPQFRERIERELDRIAALPENWNREGAPRISPAIIESARNFVSRLPSNLAKVPAVVPMARGNLQLEWNEGSSSLELEFETPTTIRYLKWAPDVNIEEEDSFPVTDSLRAEMLIRWFLGSYRNVRR